MSNGSIINGGAEPSVSPGSNTQEQPVNQGKSIPICMKSKEVPQPVELLDPQQLRQSLKQQVEYYFTREKLATDAFLVSQMNSELFVPISVVADFELVKSLTTDLDVLVEALRESSQLTVDSSGTKVKPNFTIQRNTIVLRDIPPEVPEEEIKEIFSGEGNPTVKSANPDFGNTWFVTFETEEETLNMLNFIRGKSFQGKPIAGRIKSENILKGFYKPNTNLNASPAVATLGNFSNHQQYGYTTNTQYPGSLSDTNPYRPYKHGPHYKHQYSNDKHPSHNTHSHQYEKPESQLRYPSSHRGKREFRIDTNHYRNSRTEHQDHQLHQNHSRHHRHQTQSSYHHRPHYDFQQLQTDQRKGSMGTQEPTQSSGKVYPPDSEQKYQASQPCGDDTEQEHNKQVKKQSKRNPFKVLSNNHQDKQERKLQEGKKLQSLEKVNSRPKPESEQFPPLPSKSGSVTPTQQDVKPYNSSVAISEIVKSLKPGDFKLINRKAELGKENHNREADNTGSSAPINNKDNSHQKKQNSSKEPKALQGPEKPQNQEHQYSPNVRETEHDPDHDYLLVKKEEFMDADEQKPNNVPSSAVSYAQALRQKQQKKERINPAFNTKITNFIAPLNTTISETDPVSRTTGTIDA